MKDDKIINFPLAYSLKTKSYIQSLDDAKQDDKHIRHLFLSLWSDGTESPRYDSDKWNLFRDMLRERGIDV